MHRLALTLALIALPAAAQFPPERVVAGLSQDEVAITAGFTGSEILVFGAVQRDSPVPDDTPLQVIVTVAGPDRPVTVRRKDRRFGIWVNSEFAEIDTAPTFYAVATTAPLGEVLTEVEDLRHDITIPRAIRAVGTGVDSPESFTEALIRIRRSEGLYQMLEDSVTLREETLFDTAIRLPANLVEGTYDVRIYLTRAGVVISEYTTAINVQKVGLERFIYTLAHDRPLVYGLASLAVAIAAGWGASAAFRLLRS